jgi:valine--pyruvate aminotransferase
MDISRDVVKPYYMRKAVHAMDLFRSELEGIPHRIHKPEGAIFLWIWFQDLPCTSVELYERLKARNTLVIPGQYFFPGMEHEYWQHKYECIRVTYAQDDIIVKQGIRVIGEEVRRLFEQNHKE